MHDELATPVVSTARRLGYDGLIFWIVEVFAPAAIVIGVVVITVAIFKRHKTNKTPPPYTDCSLC